MRRGTTTAEFSTVLLLGAIAVLLALDRGAAWLAPVVAPPTPAPVAVTTDPELVIVLVDGKRVTDAATEAAAAKLTAGTYQVQGIPKPGEVGFVRTIVVSEGTVPKPVPVPTPTPDPKPEPKPPPDPPPPVKATAAIYVYEKDDGPIPPPVLSALDKLNRDGEKKIVATIFEEDTPDGTGQVPEQYKVPLAAAQAAGLPALVVTAGNQVLRVVKAPKTEQAVLEAVP